MTHDATIVGFRTAGIVNFWLVKQSWGSNHGIYKGYQKIQATESWHDSVFCMQMNYIKPTPLDYQDPQDNWAWKSLENPHCDFDPKDKTYQTIKCNCRAKSDGSIYGQKVCE